MNEKSAIPSDAAPESDIGVASEVSGKHQPPHHVSEWEALQIAQAGDLDTINTEIEEIEADLQRLNLQSTWYKPLLNFKNPKTFNYLLVGKLHRTT
jgi:hypothetical protein